MTASLLKTAARDQTVAKRLGDDLLFVAEMRVDRTGAELAFLSDISKRHTLDPLSRDARNRATKDAFALGAHMQGITLGHNILKKYVCSLFRQSLHDNLLTQIQKDGTFSFY
nr:hypothetical protein [Novosphingobium panipatense]